MTLILRNWKNWLFPALTVLIVAGLALLPLWLSAAQDGRLTGVIHSEELGEDSNFPARPPDLLGRIWLLAQRESAPEGLAIMDQELEGPALEEAAALAVKELETLETAGILPQGFSGRLETFSGNRIYLRDREDLSSASFWEINGYEQKSAGYCWIYLDGETGRILGLEIVSEGLVKQLVSPEALSRAFLEGLGLSWSEVEAGGGEAVFHLTDGRTVYWAVRDWDYLRLFPTVDWAALDEDSAAVQKMLGPQSFAGGSSVYDSDT